MTEVTIGIDVSKDRLDVHRLPTGEEQAFANTKSGLTELIRWLGAGPVLRINFEPTGRYHRDLERRLAAAGYALVKVNPRQAKRFCEALGVGIRNKTHLPLHRPDLDQKLSGSKGCYVRRPTFHRSKCCALHEWQQRRAAPQHLE